MSEPKPKKYKDAVQDAKKSEATNLEAKFKPNKGSRPKEPWPFAVSGKPNKGLSK